MLQLQQQTHCPSQALQRKQTLLLQSYHKVMELDAHHRYQRTTNFNKEPSHHYFWEHFKRASVKTRLPCRLHLKTLTLTIHVLIT